MDDSELEDKLDLLLATYQEIKKFERWKAGGFLIDHDIMSNVPNIEQVIDELIGCDEEESEEDCDGEKE